MNSPEHIYEKAVVCKTAAELLVLIREYETALLAEGPVFDPGRLLFLWKRMREIAPQALLEFPDILREDLLPRATAGPLTGSDIKLYQISRGFRDFTSEWMLADADVVAVSLIDDVAGHISENLEALNPEDSSFFLEALGRRTDTVFQNVQNFADKHQDKTGDIAFATLINLGATDEQKNLWFGEILSRLDARPSRQTLYLASVACTSTTAPRLLKAFSDLIPFLGEKIEVGDFLLNLRAASQHAEKEDRDAFAALFEAAWLQRPDEAENTFFLGSNVLPKWDSPEAITLLAKVLGASPESPNLGYRCYLFEHRLSECSWPRQIALNPNLDETALELLRNEVFRVLSENGSQGFEGQVKTRSLNACLGLGDLKLVEEFEKILTAETHWTTRHKLVELLACFRLMPFPKRVADLITDPNDIPVEGEAGRLFDTLDAFKIAASNPCRESFQALLHSQFTSGGTVLLEPVATLESASVELSRSSIEERDYVVTELLSGLRHLKNITSQSAICRSIDGCARWRFLEKPEFEFLDNYIVENHVEVENFNLSLLIQAVCGTPDYTPSEGLRRLVLKWATQNDWLGWRAVESLITNPRLNFSDFAILSHYGIRRDENGVWRWKLSKPSHRLSLHFVSQLYHFDSDGFELALVDALQLDDFASGHEIVIAFSRWAAAGTLKTSPRVEAALISRALSRNNAFQTDTASILCLPYIAPRTFEEVDWLSKIEAWRVESREALATAFGSPALTQSGERPGDLLLQLLADESAVVRKAAGRSIIGAFPEVARDLARNLLDASSVAARRLAAEVVGYLPADQLHDELISKAAADIDLRVRNAAKDAKSERSRRDMACLCLRFFDGVVGTNEEVSRCWRYGTAFRRVCDSDDLEALAKISAKETISPNFRYFLELLEKKSRESWEKREKKLRDAPSPSNTTLEESSGEIAVPGGASFSGSLLLWHSSKLDGTLIRNWGGTLKGAGDSIMKLEPGTTATLILRDGRRGKIIVHRIASEGEASFDGIEAYPSRHRIEV